MRPELVKGKRTKAEGRDLDREEREDLESENSDMEDQDASEQSDSYKNEEGFAVFSKINYNYRISFAVVLETRGESSSISRPSVIRSVLNPNIPLDGRDLPRRTMELEMPNHEDLHDVLGHCFTDPLFQSLLRFPDETELTPVQVSLVHSHWSRTIEALLSLVEIKLLIRQLSYAIKKQLKGAYNRYFPCMEAILLA